MGTPIRAALLSSCILLTAVFSPGVQAADSTSIITVHSATPGPLHAVATPRTILLLKTDGDSQLRLEMPPLLAGLPAPTYLLTGRFDGASHSVTLTAPGVAAACTLTGPGETVCNLAFADAWTLDVARAKSYVRTRGFSGAETSGREAVIDDLQASHQATLKVRTRIAF